MRNFPRRRALLEHFIAPLAWLRWHLDVANASSSITTGEQARSTFPQAWDRHDRDPALSFQPDRFYFIEDVVIRRTITHGTHNGDLALPAGTIPPTGKAMRIPCCDVFRAKDGRITSFHCHVAVPILFAQPGVFMNLAAAPRH